MNPDNRLMTTDEVAEYLGVPKGSLYRWNSHGTGPEYFRVGKHVRYRRSAVDRWLEENRSQAAA